MLTLSNNNLLYYQIDNKTIKMINLVLTQQLLICENIQFICQIYKLINSFINIKSIVC